MAGQPSQSRRKSDSQSHGRKISPQTPQLPGIPDTWLQHIKDIYPNRQHQTYFLPPLYFKRVPHISASFEGENVVLLDNPAAPSPQSRSSRRKLRRRQESGGAPAPVSSSASSNVPGHLYTLPPDPLSDSFVQESDLQDEQATELVLQHLHRLSEHLKTEAMMVLSHLKFMKYLGSPGTPADKAACSALPRVTSLAQTLHQGDLDILIIHRHCGILVGEVKSVKPSEGQKDRGEFLRSVVSRVNKAVGQLEKAKAVLEHVVKDVGKERCPVKVTKLIVLPNATRADLKAALESDATVCKKVTACLEVSDLPLALLRCLVSDDRSLSGSGARASQTVVPERLLRWWKGLAVPCEAMEDTVSDVLLSRFCGPATAVEIPTVAPPHKVIKTPGQSVAETGLRFSTLALYPSQLNLLRKPSAPRVFLTGPPGTGKTVVLCLKAKQWLHDNEADKVPVNIVSTQYKGRTVSILLQRQVQESSKATIDPSRVQRHDFNFDASEDEVDRAVRDLEGRAVNGRLFVIVDEVGSRYRDRFSTFCTRLLERVPSLCLWAANLNNEKIPECLEEEQMTIMLRCPPVIHREVKQSSMVGLDCPSYSATPSTATEGPDIKWLRHRGQSGHTDLEVKHCPQCGKQIATVLRELQVGQAGAGGLQYRDVLVIYYDPDDETMTSDRVTSEGQPTSSTWRPPIVEGLVQSGIPCTVLKRHDTVEAYTDVALGLSDKVTISHWENVSGLERRVVVGMGEVTHIDRFYVMSRCTSQLIWIESRDHHTGEATL